MTPVTEQQQQAFADAFAAQLKSERALRGLDQAAVAEGAESFSLRTYSRIEGGDGANLRQMVEIASIFGLTLPELMARTQIELERRAANPPAPQSDRKKHVTAATTKRKKAPTQSQITKSSRR